MINDTRSKASSSRAAIFVLLRALPHDDKFLGHLVTKKAKELGLVSAEKKSLKGKTIKEWSESSCINGYNTPNAWACTAASHLLLSNDSPVTIDSDATVALAYYLDPADNEETMIDSMNKVHTWLGGHTGNG